MAELKGAVNEWIRNFFLGPNRLGLRLGTVSSSTSLDILQSNGTGFVNRPVRGAETSINTPVAGANDTAIGSGTRNYTFFTAAATAPFWLVTGFEVLNGTVVHGSWQCGIESVDANLPSVANSACVAWSAAVLQAGASAVQRIGPNQIGGTLLEAGRIYGAFLVSNSATATYGSTTVSSGNRQKSISLGTINLTNTNAWAAATEEHYIRVYVKPVLGV